MRDTAKENMEEIKAERLEKQPLIDAEIALDQSVDSIVFLEYEIVTTRNADPNVPKESETREIEIEMEPVDETLIRSSVRAYLDSYRDVKLSSEDMATKILEHISEKIKFNRLFIEITSEHGNDVKEVHEGIHDV